MATCVTVSALPPARNQRRCHKRQRLSGLCGFGFKPDRPAVLYLLSNVDAGLGKVGITNVDADTSESYRLDFFRRHRWAVEAVWYFPVGSAAYRTEQELLLWVRARHPSFAVTREGASGGSGRTEMFPSSDLEAVRRRLLAEPGTSAVPFDTEQAA